MTQPDPLASGADSLRILTLVLLTIVLFGPFEACVSQTGSTARTSAAHNGVSVQTANLVISPQLVYSTLLAGSGTAGSTKLKSPGRDQANALAVDANGRVYIAGSTMSIDFPVTSDAYQKSNRGAPNAKPNVFVTVLDPSKPSGEQLLYSTYLGGSGGDKGDAPLGIAVGPHGLIYVAGDAWSPDFPVTPGAFQKVNRSFGRKLDNNFGAANAFLAVLDPHAPCDRQLVYSTYLGGTGGDLGNAIAVDADGFAYVAGLTDSTDFPVTPTAFQESDRGFSGYAARNGSNGFLSIFNPSASGKSSLTYSSYLGGSFTTRMPYGGDSVNRIALDSVGLVYLTGGASSLDFPVTLSAFQRSAGKAPGESSAPVLNAFLTVVNPRLSARRELVYSTYLGGTNVDTGSAVAVDTTGSAYVAGDTCLNGMEHDDDFPVTPHAFQISFPHPENGGCRAFASKLNPRISGRGSLVYSTYFGGGACSPPCAAEDEAHGIAVDAKGRMYVAGRTTSINLPVTRGALQTTGPTNFTAFVSVLDPNAKGGSALVYSTYLGGAKGIDGATDLKLGPRDLVYIAGNAGYFGGVADWPVTSNAFERTRPIPLPSPAPPATLGIGGAFMAILNPAAVPALSATAAPTGPARDR